MSILTTTHTQVHTNPSNNSPTKAQFSFNKEPRFESTYKHQSVYYNANPNCNHCYHEKEKFQLHSTLSKQSGKFNERPRLEDVFVEINRQHKKNPSAFHYKLPSVFKDQKIKHKHAESTIKSSRSRGQLSATMRSFNGADSATSLSLL